jgi:carbon-monoxide dehydrogenase medium subunit
VKAAAFDYYAPDTLEEALHLLAEYGDDARLLAGGQSLIPMMSMRVAQPAILIDINRVADLSEVRIGKNQTQLGATTRYRTVSQISPTDLPLLPTAMSLVAHSGVRNRGTIGGSLALADPAAETPACCICVGAKVVLQSSARGARCLSTSNFIEGTYATALAPDEMIVAIDFARPRASQRFAIREVAVRHGDFAQVGLCAAAELEDNGFSNLRLVYFGFGDRATEATSAATALTSGNGSVDMPAVEAAAALLDIDLEFSGSRELSAANQRHIASGLLKSVIKDLTKGTSDV